MYMCTGCSGNGGERRTSIRNTRHKPQLHSNCATYMHNYCADEGYRPLSSSERWRFRMHTLPTQHTSQLECIRAPEGRAQASRSAFTLLKNMSGSSVLRLVYVCGTHSSVSAARADVIRHEHQISQGMTSATEALRMCRMLPRAENGWRELI